MIIIIWTSMDTWIGFLIFGLLLELLLELSLDYSLELLLDFLLDPNATRGKFILHLLCKKVGILVA